MNLEETNPAELMLTVIITVVSGKDSLRQCLSALYPQINFADSEIIVPFDKWSREVNELASDFPNVNFYFIEDLGMAKTINISAYQHRLYDRRRAIGLRLARGKIIAMTEDHAIPAKNWCRQILKSHEQPHAVIGGAIENSVDSPLNRAWYYCDFGRYGRPFESRKVDYVSDVNVSYKRDALELAREEWFEAYRETLLHWALQKNGAELFLDERLVVYQNRPAMRLNEAFYERIAWGRVFAETRAAIFNLQKRFLFAAGTLFLPPLLLLRAIKNMRRQNQSLRNIAATLPIIYLLLAGWSLGEFIGYVSGMPQISIGETNANESAPLPNQAI